MEGNNLCTVRKHAELDCGFDFDLRRFFGLTFFFADEAMEDEAQKREFA
jgi:hypothetical protein